ncbi:MAG: tetratricopeptide repeat protein [Elusimicrobia bacterium]|nr:tetratricopeptide repeat protein [Elusimicrobiota bacterium]MDE2237533.1 tetratricopeptide repeat protein [Elusimicrobiota bacterium]MDE2424742.1 tetratricopeptide repeat protein [Elusimicrobiota bacterium]
MSRALNSWRAAIAAAACLAYLGTLGARGWVRDDRWLIADNALLQGGWPAAEAVLRTGYVEAARGTAAPIEEYRPLLSLSFLAQLATTGRRPAPFHAVNLLLHAAVCLLLFNALRLRLPLEAAGSAALLFALLPIHAEAVSYITSRSELLAALAWLGCWEFLGARREKPRLAAGLSCFAAGLLSKESAAMIPAFLALSDWVFEGLLPWSRRRLAVYAGLGLVAAAYLAARAAVLPQASAGVPFFAGRLDAALLWPVFALRHYLWPSLSGLGLCADFSRPGSHLRVPVTAAGLLALAALLAAAAACALGLARRRPWAFWAAAPSLFLLPTCPLLVPLDTLGAERFLYIPTVSLAVALGLAFHRARRLRPAAAWAGLAALAAWYGFSLVGRNAVWSSERAYYTAACGCNPGSARARSGLGVAAIEAGQTERGRDLLLQAQRLDPSLPQPPYNLALLAFSGGDPAAAEPLARRALALDAGLSDGWVLLSLIERARGKPRQAEGSLERALAIEPWNAAAQFDLGRTLLLEGRPRQAKPHLRRFLELAPDDPDAPRVAALLERLR